MGTSEEIVDGFNWRDEQDAHVFAPSSRLSERDAWLNAISGACGGSGEITTAIIEGEPGLGKSALLEVSAAVALRAGFTVLTARCSELERHHPGEVAGQLLRQAQRELNALTRAEPVDTGQHLGDRALGWPGTEGRQMADLYGAALQLIRHRPVLVVVDDLQWCDRESSGSLSYLARRTVPGKLLLVGATLPHESSVEIGAADGIISERSTRTFRLSELSPEGVRTVMAERLGQPVRAELAAAYHEVTRGNPFLVCALLAEAVRVGGRDPGLVDPFTLTPAAVARSIRVRLASVSEVAPAVLRAVSVLGEGADLAAVATLADIDMNEASVAADALADVWVLRRQRPLCFVYPSEQATVYKEMPAALRARVHGGAARLLAERGAPFDSVAGHLVQTEPMGDPWIAEELDRSARVFASEKRHTWARHCLERALAEPLGTSDRARLLVALAASEAAEGLPATLGHLRDATDLGAEPATLAEPALLLAAVVEDDDVRADLVALLRSIAIRLDERDHRQAELRLRLEVAAAVDQSPEAALASAATIESLLHGNQAGETRLERLALAHLSSVSAHDPQRGTAQVTAEFALPLFDEDPLCIDDLVEVRVRTRALGALVRAGRFELADAAARQAVAAAEGAQRSLVAAEFSNVLVYSLLLQGALEAAEAEGYRTLVRQNGDAAANARSECVQLTQALVAAVHLARGRTEQAAELFGSSVTARTLAGLFELEQHAVYLLEAGRMADALEAADAAGQLARQWGIENPAATSWRVTAAAAQLQLGRFTPARQLAAENLRLARAFGARWALGQALRLAALVAPDCERTELLSEAVAVLESSGADLELARALIDLGAALRQQGRADDARFALRRGADVALRCGVTPLVDRARQELRASGARPRRLALTGAGSLTPMERRVADMAVAGHLNSHIAKVLFISNKTVEGHLSRVYRKLGIQSRRDLGTAMAPARALDGVPISGASTG